MKQVFAISLVLLFGSVSLFGIISMLGHNGEHGGMVTCPLMGDIASMCPMGGVGHIMAWQSVFTAMTPQMVLMLLVLVAFVVVYGVMFALHDSAPPMSTLFSGDIRSAIPAPSHLLLAFSRGILHPRLYA